LDKLKELAYWRDRWIAAGYAAAFPDGAVKGDLRLDAPRELILDASDMADLSAWVDARRTIPGGPVTWPTMLSASPWPLLTWRPAPWC